MCLCLTSCPYNIFETSVVNLTALSSPSEYAVEFGYFNLVPFIRITCSSIFKNHSASACSQIRFCGRLIKFDQFVASEMYVISTSYFGGSIILKKKKKHWKIYP